MTVSGQLGELRFRVVAALLTVFLFFVISLFLPNYGAYDLALAPYNRALDRWNNKTAIS